MGAHLPGFCDRSIVTMLGMLAVLATPSSMQAQDADADDDHRGRQRVAAAEAYDRGTAAYLAGDHAQAAKWFETANRMAPAAPAVMQAIRAHLKAENWMRAASLALLLERVYSHESGAQDYARQVLDQWADDFLLVEIECNQSCTLEVDGKLQDTPYFFAEPGVTHAVVAQFDTGGVELEASGTAGERVELRFEAPPEPVASKPSLLPTRTGETQRDTDGPQGLPPMVTYVGAGVSAVLLGVTLWSWIDAVNHHAEWARAKDSCDRDGVPEDCAHGYDEAVKSEGEGKQTRSGVLTAVTSVAALSTAAVALFLTDWQAGSKSKGDVQAGFTPLPGGGAAMLRGRF